MGVAERRKKRFLTAGLVAAVALLATVFLFGRTLFRASMLGGEDGRFCVYPGIVKSIGQNWITGTGAGSFEYVFPAHADPACGMTSAWIRAHNGYFDMALAYGVPITVVVLVFALRAALHIFAGGIKRRKSKRPLVWGGVASVILVVAHSIVDFSIQIPGFAMAFMLFLAISMKISVNKTGII
ncbi:O-antigen ligase family protein [Aliirhizobium terrae]|uniref:O-antigen ligase family protein n=1 Tax=Terrirhizobium terrae TaxID=2926709 RepID=UPI00336AC8C5